MKRLFMATAALALAPILLLAQAADTSKLKDPSALKEQAPATYKAAFDTSAGKFVIDVHRDWAPKGADRFYNLVKNGYYDDCRFFRVISGFMVQFGINGDPALNKVWAPARIQDDPVKKSNTRGMVTFAMGGPNTRTTQVFINFGNNANLDPQGFPPFGEVTSGMDVVDKLHSDYGEAAQKRFVEIQQQGNAFLEKNFPKLDYIKHATIQK